MNIHICYKNIAAAAREDIKTHLQSLGEQHIGKHLASFDHPIRFNATIEKEGHHGAYLVAIRLSLPSGNLVARERDFDLLSAMDGAAEALEWRVRRYLGKRRMRQPVPEPERWLELTRMLDAASTTDRRGFGERVLPFVDSLSRFAHRELAYLRAEDRLARDYPRASDVLDDVLVVALDSHLRIDQKQDTRRWLHGVLLEVLNKYIDEYGTWQRQGISLETEAQALSIDSDPADDNWLDDVLMLRDLIPATNAPDLVDEVARAQTQRLTLALLRRLPISWRRIVTLHCIDDLPMESVAETMGVDTKTATGILNAALASLKESLREKDIDTSDAAWPTDFLSSYPLTQETADITDELSALVKEAGIANQASRGVGESR